MLLEIVLDLRKLFLVSGFQNNQGSLSASQVVIFHSSLFIAHAILHLRILYHRYNLNLVVVASGNAFVRHHSRCYYLDVVTDISNLYGFLRGD
jgi:hypothetical protein